MPVILTTSHHNQLSEKSPTRLPSGPFNPDAHRTFTRAVEDFVAAQTDFSLGYVEQLYTFGDAGRELPHAAISQSDDLNGTKIRNPRLVSVGYLGLAEPQTAKPEQNANVLWRDWYDFFPWEDHRSGTPKILDTLVDEMKKWICTESTKDRTIEDRFKIAFGLDDYPWRDDRVLERYELLYQAQLVGESSQQGGQSHGQSMEADHRRILATAIGRVRAKLRYRPIIFRLVPGEFTLSELQISVEAIVGTRLHTQNFRRNFENSDLVVPTQKFKSGGKGRPAALFKENTRRPLDHLNTGLHLPIIRSKS